MSSRSLSITENLYYCKMVLGNCPLEQRKTKQNKKHKQQTNKKPPNNSQMSDCAKRKGKDNFQHPACPLCNVWTIDVRNKLFFPRHFALLSTALKPNKKVW